RTRAQIRTRAPARLLRHPLCAHGRHCPAVTRDAIGLALVFVLCGCDYVSGQTGAAKPASPAMSAAADKVVNDAVARLKSMASRDGRLVILLTGGAGDRASSASASIRSAFRGEPKVVFARVEQKPAAPVADPSAPGQHVNPVQTVIDPAPTVVVHVSESDGKLYIAARVPGRDP